jgi:pimeloyl-ACP methyl ester carboxylesterase
MTGGLRSGFAEVPGGRLYYEAAGDGPAVVLLHAGIADHRMWIHQMEPFAAEHTVVAYDQRAFGRSDPPTGPFSIVEDLGRLLDALDIERAAVVACSMGGAVEIEFALAHPERVTALVPVASGLAGFEWPPDPKLAEADAAEEAGDIERAVELALEIWAPLRSDPQTDRLIEQMARDNTATSDAPDEWWLDPERPAAEMLEEISAPTLVVVGDTDHPKILAIADALSARIPGARRVDIANADHLVPLRAPEAFNAAVLPFLREFAGA